MSIRVGDLWKSNIDYGASFPYYILVVDKKIMKDSLYLLVTVENLKDGERFTITDFSLHQRYNKIG